MNNGEMIYSQVVIIVVGGKSVFYIGSMGDGYEWVEVVGYIIIELFLIEVFVIFVELFIK